MKRELVLQQFFLTTIYFFVFHGLFALTFINNSISNRTFSFNIN